jgi:uncharacterized protein (TIGR00369 family)
MAKMEAGSGKMTAEKNPLGALPPAARLLGRKVIRAVPGVGEVELEFRAPASFMNRHGYVQGGLLAAMLDSAMGCALIASGRGISCVTLEMKVSYMRPARRGRIRAVGRVVQRGRSVAFLEGELRSPEGKVLATATSTHRIVR